MSSEDEQISLASITAVAPEREVTLADRMVKAAQQGDVEALGELVKEAKAENPVEYPRITDREGVSPIHWAALNNRLAAVEFLIASGLEADIVGGDLNATPILWAARYGLVYIVDMLIHKGYVSTDSVDSTGVGLLHAGVFSSNVLMVCYILNMVTDVDVDFQDPNGRTALHWAAYQGDHLSVEVLLRGGAKVDLQDSQGFSALHWALVNGNSKAIQLLLNAGSDINMATSEGKTCWTVASDMNFTDQWRKILALCQRNPSTGDKLTFVISEKYANICIFGLPHVDVPLMTLLMWGSYPLYVKIPAMGVLLGAQFLTLKKVLLPAVVKGKTSLLKTPLFAGIFSATVMCCMVSHLFVLLPYTLKEKFLMHIFCEVMAVTCYFLFWKTMNMDPGYIDQEDDPEVVKETIRDLVDSMNFDDDHFCIHTSIKKPIRARYSDTKGLNVARFDHYCPWVYNDIGLRNHKLFFGFALSLFFGILAWISIALEYFDELDDDNIGVCYLWEDDLCSGFWNSPFIFGLMVWVIFQLLWLSFLLIVQSFQISKGTTTFEFSTLNKRTHHHETPEQGDFPPKRTILQSFLQSKFAKMLGLDQLALLTNDAMHHSPIGRMLPYDYGFKQNWIDFLFLRRQGDECSLRTLMALPLAGEGNMGGQYVDYYKLYSPPASV